ncbi:class I SAM-dependent methyltransferase [Candidatus Woesearchaeota archaeon]|nr:class I SAM-dependent methyltransferase [Candidatus Woesearchaeota archaeon]
MALLSTYLRHQRLNRTRQFVKQGLLEGDVLDIGCWDAELLQFIKPKKYVGIDIEKEKIIKNKKRYPQHEFYIMDLEKDPFPPIQKVDTIILTAVIEHINNTGNFFSQLHKVLKKQGNCLITTPTPIGNWLHGLASKIGLMSKEAAHEHVSIYNIKKMKKECQNYGLRVKRHKRYQGGLNQYFIVGIK